MTTKEIKKSQEQIKELKKWIDDDKADLNSLFHIPN